MMRNVEKLRKTQLLWLGLIFIWASPLAAQESRPAEEPEPLEPIEVSFRIQVIDTSALVEANPQGHGGSSMPDIVNFAVTEGSVQLTSYNLEAEPVITEVSTDPLGWAEFDLGERFPGSPATLTAIAADGTELVAAEIELPILDGPMNFFRLTDDHSKMLQAVMKVVTVAPDQDPEANSLQVQVREIFTYRNQGFRAFNGPSDAPGVGGALIVPPGAEIKELKIDGEAALDLEPRDLGHWGYGVPIEGAMFPLQDVQVIGVYQYELEKGEIHDFGFTTLLDTLRVVLALEQGEFTHDAQVAAEFGSPQLPNGQLQEMPDVERSMMIYTVEQIPAHTNWVAAARFGPPGIRAGTIWATILIIACFLVPIIAGFWIVRSRSDSGGRLQKLQRLHAQGELSDADYTAELSKLQGDAAGGSMNAPPFVQVNRMAQPAVSEEVLFRLKEITERIDPSGDQVATDIRALAQIIHEHFESAQK